MAAHRPTCPDVENCGSTPSVVDVRGLSFYVLMDSLYRQYGEPGGEPSLRTEPGREVALFKSDASIAFPGSDLSMLECSDTGQFTLMTKFLGFSGSQSPLPGYYLDRMAREQHQATARWNETLKTRAQNSPQLRGWLQTRQELRAFADLVMRREKEGLTLSYIKNVVWQAERGLGQETPLESLITQYQDAQGQGQNIDTLEKQINERLDGIASRWLLLKNHSLPEAATTNTDPGK